MLSWAHFFSVFRPGNLEHDARVSGYVRGFKRRFWQSSEDHRGVPGAPGLVVTCVPADLCADDDVHQDFVGDLFGVAYRVPQEKRDEVLAYLDHREKGGYTRHFVPVFGEPDADEPILDHALLYAGTADNPFFAGPSSLTSMAAQIGGSTGPSGPNRDYLFQLADSLREHNVSDVHVFDLERMVKEFLQTLESEPTTTANANRDENTG